MFTVERFYIAIARAMFLERRPNDEKGAAMVEYGLLVAFIAVVALIAVKALGTNVSSLFNKITF